jgi:hypothetical protein
MLRRVIVMFALSGALAGYVTALLLPRRYLGQARLAVTAPFSIEDAAQKTLSAQTLSPMILQSPYYLPILNYTPLDEVVRQIRDNSAIVPEKNAVCLVQFTDDDRYAALDMTHNLLEEMRRNLGNARVRDGVRVVATGPGYALCALEGLAAGLFIGLCVVFLAARSAG